VSVDETIILSWIRQCFQSEDSSDTTDTCQAKRKAINGFGSIPYNQKVKATEGKSLRIAAQSAMAQGGKAEAQEEPPILSASYGVPLKSIRSTFTTESNFVKVTARLFLEFETGCMLGMHWYMRMHI